MTATTLKSRSGLVPNTENTIAQKSSIALARHIQKGEDLKIRVVGDQEEEVIVLPAAIVTLLLGMLRMQANGLSVALTPLHSELTTSQAADIINVSRPYLIKLLEAGEIPYFKVGSHRRIRREDVMTYKQNQRRERTAILDELTAEAQRLGLYD
ncbi:MAG: helix-turn-helix domain-containing protein [Chloroflexi bacterium]|nr:helix-turn-helix domain-containing protein [Chloroflexota bacterium]MCY3582297.1 helix-turn-helix domain-containing protein [Chloroflexota bacterium]MCY3717277.1 helix-turn-helix domain-containing protein [Chloroflexota bacterium]MDE2651754.1 helix-turn-helix domain-containing protein [Chloroflexota bacterium]MXV92355.1 helix-turn-helix domain-containing protein [Chloroflexota bacterium]